MSRDIKKLRAKFMEIAPGEAAFTGWNDDMMANVSQRLQLPAAYHMLLFPNGVKEVVTAFETQLDTYMKKNFEGNSIRIRDKVRDAILLRLKGEHKQNKSVLIKLLAFYKKPTNIALSIANAWRTVDKIWYLAGDEATDFNYYTKRALLFPVYKAAQKFYAANDLDSTKAFVEKRLEDVMQLGKMKGSIKSLKDKIPFLRLMKK